MDLYSRPRTTDPLLVAPQKPLGVSPPEGIAEDERLLLAGVEDTTDGVTLGTILMPT